MLGSDKEDFQQEACELLAFDGGDDELEGAILERLQECFTELFLLRLFKQRLLVVSCS